MRIEPSHTITVKDHLNFMAMVSCFWLAIYIYAPVFGVYLQHIGFSYAAIGVILGSYGITQVLLRLPLGILSDYLQRIRKHLLVVGFIMALLSNLIFVFFDSFFMVLVARLLVGVTASVWVMATVLYSYYFSPNQSAKAMGTLQFITVGTQFVGMAVSGYLVYLAGWSLPFWVGAFASIAGIFFAVRIKDVQVNEVQSPRLTIKDHLHKLRAVPNLKLLTFASLIGHAVLFITIFGFTPIVAVSLGVSEERFFWLIGAFFIPHISASFLFIFRTFSVQTNQRILKFSFVGTAISLVVIPTAKSLLMLSVYHAGLGLALGFVFPIILSEVVRISPSNLKMSAMGFHQSFYALGILFGPFLAGIIAEQMGLNEVFIFTGIASFLVAGILALLYKVK
ncbi:MFS transporter [Sporosarcina sp. CAU 1771]